MRRDSEPLVVGPRSQADPFDPRLVAAARAGDVAAMECLSCAYRPVLLRYLAQLTRDFELASDLTQDAFVRAFERIDQLNNDASFVPWLYRIARNLWVSKLRWLRVRRAVSLDWMHEHRPSSALPSASDAIVTYAEREAVHQVLANLSAADREVLVLRHVAGFRAWEIAEIVGISSEAVQKRIVRAEERFRDTYQQRNWGHGHATV